MPYCNIDTQGWNCSCLRSILNQCHSSLLAHLWFLYWSRFRCWWLGWGSRATSGTSPSLSKCSQDYSCSFLFSPCFSAVQKFRQLHGSWVEPGCRHLHGASSSPRWWTLASCWKQAAKYWSRYFEAYSWAWYPFPGSFTLYFGPNVSYCRQVHAAR